MPIAARIETRLRWKTWLRWSMARAPVGEDQRRNAGWLIMAVWRWVLRALRIVMIWFMVAFVLAFILLAVVIQRIASWARGLLRSN